MTRKHGRSRSNRERPARRSSHRTENLMTIDRPTITPDPDRDGVILHLPEITYLDTQTWAVDVGLTTAGLAALRAALGVPAVVEPPADRAALRDRIAEALEQADYRPDMQRGDLADAIMPVLPPPVDRAAVLREAADAIEEAQHRRDDAANDRLGRLDDRTFAQHIAVHRSGKLLRRMADETPAAERPACPHCGLPHDLTPSMELACASIRASISDRDAADDEPAAETQPKSCAHCGKDILRITGTLAAWWVHDPGGNTVCHPEQAASSPRATPKPADETAATQTEATRCSCGGRFPISHLHADVHEPAAGARQNGAQPCGECGHPKATHREGDEPVSPGWCALCPDDDAWHDYQPAAEAHPA